MKSYLKIILFGIFVWLVPFLVSIFIYPLKTAGNPLFESIMPLVITIMVVILAYSYLNGVKTDLIKEGMIIGTTWFIINIIIDLALFLPSSPMQMTLTNYMMDIGITYLMIPVITMGMGYMAENKGQI
ncbi:MAG: hypothetical protein A4E27_00383 [Methanobacterium sp. PtaU1.Bin242]|nr:MAG: hypothetical protein A4E27_00383 [Methanobacterium sp. PtaU1.Bin242]